MGYIVDADSTGTVGRIIDTGASNSPEDEVIIDQVNTNGHYQINGRHYYDATGFITAEADKQGVAPMNVDLSDFVGYCPDSDLEPEMFTASQWIKAGAETP